MADNTIQSVRRAIQILGLFSLDRIRLGLSEISQTLGLNKATVQGLVRTLVQEGLLQKDKETRKYCLGLKIFEMGLILAGSLEINQKSSVPAQQLAKKTQRLVRVAILNEWSALVTIDVYPRAPLFLARSMGTRVPLHCTGLGKALLAFLTEEDIETYLTGMELTRYTPNTITDKSELLKELEETRARGFSVCREEHLFTRCSIGAPIFGRDGAAAASVCVSVETAIGHNQMQAVASDVMSTAQEISHLMGFSPRPM
jgi:IclR family transcriptional regulator, KDG regulon repressor